MLPGHLPSDTECRTPTHTDTTASGDSLARPPGLGLGRGARRQARLTGAAVPLLEDVRELVRQQKTPGGRTRPVSTIAEHDPAAVCVGIGVEPSGRCCCFFICVYAYVREAYAEALFHLGTRIGIQ